MADDYDDVDEMTYGVSSSSSSSAAAMVVVVLVIERRRTMVRKKIETNSIQHNMQMIMMTIPNTTNGIHDTAPGLRFTLTFVPATVVAAAAVALLVPWRTSLYEDASTTVRR